MPTVALSSGRRASPALLRVASATSSSMATRDLRETRSTEQRVVLIGSWSSAAAASAFLPLRISCSRLALKKQKSMLLAMKKSRHSARSSGVRKSALLTSRKLCLKSPVSRMNASTSGQRNSSGLRASTTCTTTSLRSTTRQSWRQKSRFFSKGVTCRCGFLASTAAMPRRQPRNAAFSFWSSSSAVISCVQAGRRGTGRLW
mmetsp:Transcript_22141/g.70735  ORF Transcript_22141/g.70735 Transcript_22141/m.70735 type:complete len:202 (-) Transcript_22141:432-1037(-)